MGIASYEFDFQSMARVALETIAHPEVVRRSEGQVITLRGHVVVRGSLRSARSFQQDREGCGTSADLPGG